MVISLAIYDFQGQHLTNGFEVRAQNRPRLLEKNGRYFNGRHLEHVWEKFVSNIILKIREGGGTSDIGVPHILCKSPFQDLYK